MAVNLDPAALSAALAGDEAAFGQVVERHRRELGVHCYRMLGSYDDAEDMVQETFLRAWRRRETYQGRSTFRAWLYRIATNACLDFLARHPRRPAPYRNPPGTASVELPPRTWSVPEPGRRPVEVAWLQPYPDRLLEPAASADTEPDALVVARETIELTFLIAIQHLPPRQRAVLILRDVLGWRAAEAAAVLDSTEASVKSALQRARQTLKNHLPPRRDDWKPTTEPTEEERQLLERYMAATEHGDAEAIGKLLAEDVTVSMPPDSFWLIGRDPVVELNAAVFDPASPWFHGAWRCVPIQANRQPAVAHYCRPPGAADYQAQALELLRVENGQIVELVGFDPQLFAAFGLPSTLPA